MLNTSLFRIADKRLWYQIRDHFGEGGGTYAVIAKQGEQVVSIPRLLGEDQQGRLYIGKADSFLDRVINLKKSTDPEYRSSSHDFGNRYKEHSAIQLQFPYDHLYLVLTGHSNPAVLEKVQMQAYLDTFGELPPLNRNLQAIDTLIIPRDLILQQNRYTERIEQSKAIVQKRQQLPNKYIDGQMNLKTVTKAAFLEDARDISVEEDYHKIYQHFLAHFQQIEVLDHHQLVIGISLIYSWMPTIPTIDFQDFDQVVLALERIRQENVLTDQDLEIVKACINNSLVGTSKLLHFLCPDRFPIWDSRVARYFLGREPYQLVNSFQHYRCYVNFCREVIHEPSYEEIHRGIQQQLNDRIGLMRSVEYVMFLMGKRKAKEGTVAVRKR